MIENRVKLVPLDISHNMYIVKWRNDPDITQYLFISDLVTIESHIKWFMGYKKSDTRKEFVIYTIEDNVAIGTVGLSQIDGVNSKAELSIILGERDYRGKGFGQESLILILKYAFQILTLNKVFLKVFQYNTRAIKMYKKAGFMLEGILRQDIYKNGIYNDVIEMSIIKDEWFNFTDK